MISLIVPLRFGNTLFDGPIRLEKLLQSVPADLFEVVVVDYGSAVEEATIVKSITSRYAHARYVYVPASHAPFSAGIARNVGAEHARHSTIMFNDVDVLCSQEMYRRIHDEAEARDIGHSYDFFSIPIAFLTYEGVQEYSELHEANSESKADALFQYHLIRGNSQFLLNMAYSGSTIVVSRNLYLSIGGTNAEFHGHGAEDFEVKLRLTSYRPVGVRPLDFYRNTKTNQLQDFVGFRSYLSLYGYEVFFRGIYMVHLWHPRREVASALTAVPAASYRQTDRNFALMTQMIKAFETKGSQPAPLQDKSSNRKTMVLCRPNGNAHNSLRQVLPLLGAFEVIDESSFKNSEMMGKTFFKNGFTHILFLNPYGNEHRLSLYNWVKREGIPYWVHDRGALPHSWFFDPNGFNSSSSSYDAEHWDHPISEHAKRDVASYLQAMRASAETLEVNGAPKSSSYWKARFGVGHRKVLFVPLQRPSDTVTRYFGGPVGPYENFYFWVSAVASRLDPAEWVVLCKKHPAETIRPNIPGVVFVPDDAHVHDMLDLCDSVLLLNSGVGLLSLAFGKPVVACGESFYAATGLAQRANSIDDAVTKIENPSLDEEKVFRFLHYLLTSFYSFGKTEYVEVDNGSSKFLAAREIRYSSIRLLTDEPVLFGPPPRQASLDSILYATFGGAEAISRAKKSKWMLQPPTPATKVNNALVVSPESASSGASAPATGVRPTEDAKANVALTQEQGSLKKKARQAYHNGAYAEAASLFAELAIHTPGDAESHRSAAEAFDLANQIAEARKHIRIAGELLPENKNLKKRIAELSLGPIKRRVSKQTRFKVPLP